jgi:hypothetical protein
VPVSTIRVSSTCVPAWSTVPVGIWATHNTTTFVADSRTPAAETAGVVKSERSQELVAWSQSHTERWSRENWTSSVVASLPAAAAVDRPGPSNWNCSGGGAVRSDLAWPRNVWMSPTTLCGALREESRLKPGWPTSIERI